MEPAKPAEEPIVHFCDLCQESVAEADLATGRAAQVRGRLVCPACRRRLVPPLPGAWLAAGLALLAGAAAGGSAWLAWQARAGLVPLQARIGGLEAALEQGLERAERAREAEQRALLARLSGLSEASAAGERRLEQRLGSFAESHSVLEAGLARLGKELQAGLHLQAERLGALEEAVRDQVRTLARMEGALETLRAAPPPPPPEPDPEPQEPAKPQIPTELARLEAELASPDADARWRALEALEAHGGVEAARLAAAVLGDPDLWVRRLAAEVLGKLGGEPALEGLIRTLADGELVVRAAAIASLRKLAGQDLGFDPQASAADRRRAIQKWEAWWADRAAR